MKYHLSVPPLAVPLCGAPPAPLGEGILPLISADLPAHTCPVCAQEATRLLQMGAVAVFVGVLSSCGVGGTHAAHYTGDGYRDARGRWVAKYCPGGDDVAWAGWSDDSHSTHVMTTRPRTS